MAHLLVGYVVKAIVLGGPVRTGTPRPKRRHVVPEFEAVVHAAREAGQIVTISGDDAIITTPESGLPIGIIRIVPLTVEV